MSINLRKKILIPLILVFLGMALTFIAVYQYEQQRKLNALKELTLASVNAYYDSNISARTRKLEVLEDEIISDPVIVRELKAQNRNVLLTTLKERYKIYREVGNVTHLYFHTPQGINLLRLHQPQRHGDQIERFTMKQAMKGNTVSAGVELGGLGTLTLRVVKPVFQDGEVVGYIELGEEVGDIYENIIASLGINIYLLINESLLSEDELPSFINVKAMRGVVPDEVLYQFYHHDIPSYLIKALNTDLNVPKELVEFAYQETHLLGVVPLVDAGGQVIGRMVIDKDVTALVTDAQRSVVLVTLAILGLWAMVCVILYIVLGRFEKRLNSSVESLHEKETTLLNAQRIAQLSSWTLTPADKVLSCSEEFCELIGLTLQQSPTTLDELIAYIHYDDQEIFKKYVATAIKEQGVDDLLHRVVTAEGVEKWVKLRVASICTLGYPREIIQAVVQDVTDLHGAEVQATKLGSLLKYSWNEIYLFHGETLKFVEVSEGALRNLGYSLTEIQEMTPLDLKSEMDRTEFHETIQRLRNEALEQVLFETVHRRKDGSRYPVEVRLQYCRDVTPPLFMAIIQDITERKRYISELERKALYDELTGLPNRALLCDRMGELIKQAKRNSSLFAVLVLEISRINEIGDVLGYETGDEVIKQLAARMVTTLRQSDVVGHLGGGVFVLLLSLDQEEKIQPLMEKLIRLLQLPVVIQDISIDVDLSIGAAHYPRHGDEPSLLLRHADMAMQHAKAELLTTMVYEDASHPFSVRRLQLIAELRQAIMHEQLVVFYQPKVNVTSGVIESVEALVRWPTGKENDWIGPAEFIPLAEQTGLIHPLTLLVLRQAISQCHRWLEAGLDINVAINLSARNLLDRALPETIRSMMAEYEVPAKNITLEVTESMMMRQPERALEILNQLHDQGLGISIDDYGTGYSSLAYLKQLPVQELKIDQSFIRNMLINDNDAIIVRSTIDLAHNLGLRTIAEGVEDRDTWATLRSLGCDLIQGYYASRPVSAAVFEKWHQHHDGCFKPA